MLEVIESREVLGKEFKIYGTFEEPLFLAKDVAVWIEVKNHRDLLTRVEEDEKVVGLTDTLGGVQETWFLTEDGLYEVLMQSRKPLAKQFKKQVKGILKALRQNKIQMTNTTNDNQVGNVINEMKEVLNAVTNLANQLSTMVIQQNNMMNMFMNNFVPQTQIQTDEIELEISNFKNELLTVKDFGTYLNDKDIVAKKIGVQTLLQLYRENNLLDNNNKIINSSYFKTVNKKLYLTKEGMVATYKLVKEQITNTYMVRKGINNRG